MQEVVVLQIQRLVLVFQLAVDKVLQQQLEL
jgi:hypothetical protein